MQITAVNSEKSILFVISLTGLLGGFIGLITGIANGVGFWGLVVGAIIAF